MYAIAYVTNVAIESTIGGGGAAVFYTATWGDGLGVVLGSGSGHITYPPGNNGDQIRAAVQNAVAALVLAGQGTAPPTVIHPQDVQVFGM